MIEILDNTEKIIETLDERKIVRVLQENDFGFAIVQMENGEKHVINKDKNGLNADLRPLNLDQRKLDEYKKSRIAWFRYPKLEKVLTGADGNITLDDKKIAGYIVETMVGANIRLKPSEWVQNRLDCLAKNGDRFKNGVFLGQLNADLSVAQIPVEAFRNHPELFSDAKNEAGKSLDAVCSYLRETSSAYSGEQKAYLNREYQFSRQRSNEVVNMTRDAMVGKGRTIK